MQSTVPDDVIIRYHPFTFAASSLIIFSPSTGPLVNIMHDLRNLIPLSHQRIGTVRLRLDKAISDVKDLEYISVLYIK